MIKFKDLYVSLDQGQDFIHHPGIGTTSSCGKKIQELKNYLKEALEITESFEQEAEEQELKTVAEIEMLEEKLKAALDELRARRANLAHEAA
jgi:hypothetical protein